MGAARSKKKKSASKRIWLTILTIAVVAVAYFAFEIFGPNTGSFSEGPYLYIHTGSTYEQVKESLVSGGYVRNIRSFDLLARQINYPEHIHPGKYTINKGMSNYAIIRLLHSGRQTPVKLVINKLRKEQDFINLLGQNLEADSNVLKQMFHDPVYLSQFGLDTNTLMCAVMPDTYDFFWNTTADKAFRKIEKSYAHFWTPERIQQAKNHDLTPQQAITVASIVDEETNKNDEKAKIASVYLNRLHKGIRLQADPTVKFAIGDFTIRRITGAHLQFSSPYNTYLNTGLPPGPICTPSVASIEAVLQAPATDYLYFCAKEDFSGYHRFAATLQEHMQNAHLYQQALNERGIH
ncbi:MAG: endolytic transglycosylase MltG [Bacteroidetes bacterium]|nr:endolytic transglycosylase MltG [Bacteroidota bacterium]